MNHKGTVRLETERLVLRRFVLGDAPAMFANWTNDEDVTRFLTWLAHVTEGVTEAVVDSWVQQYHQPEFYQWAIELRELGDAVGTTGVACGFLTLG